MTEALPPPTDEVRRLVELIGPEAALALVEEHGGTRLYIPKSVTERLTALVGDRAGALAEAWGGENIKVPLARAWRVLIYRDRGMTYPAIARKVGSTESAVGRILARHERTAHQFDLFV